MHNQEIEMEVRKLIEFAVSARKRSGIEIAELALQSGLATKEIERLEIECKDPTILTLLYYLRPLGYTLSVVSK